MDTTSPEPQGGWHSLLGLNVLPYSAIFAGGVVLHAMNVFVSTTILPSVVEEIGGMAYYAWVTTLFTVFSIVSAALSAKLVGRLGARGAYLAGFAIFALGTAICGSAGSILVLNVGRAVQGFGGGALYALSYIVIRLVFPLHLRAVAVGLITVMWGIATLTGPAIGGIFAEMGQWRMAFWSLLPVVAAIALLCVVFLPSGGADADSEEALPLPQLAGMAAIVILVSMAGSAERIGLSLICLFGAGVLLLGTMRMERRAQARIFPIQSLVFGNPLGRVYLFVALMLLGMQPEIYVPYFAQMLFGQSPLFAGYVGAVMALGWTLGSILSAGYQGARAVLTSKRGAAISLAGLVLCTAVLAWPGGGMVAFAALCLGLAGIGFGIGYCWPHVTTSVYALAPDGEEGRAAGGVTTVQLFATAIGAALAGLLVNAGRAVADDRTAAVMLFGSLALAPAMAWRMAARAG